MQNFKASLTLEQEFKLRQLKNDIEKLTLDQAKQFLYESLRQQMVKETLLKKLLTEI